MLDSKNREIRDGDMVEITGAYFKNDNGIYLVTDASGNSLSLRRLNKSGKLAQSGGTHGAWPLHSYCSDSRKNAAARAHNKEHAEITLREGINTWYAAEYFKKEASDILERLNNRLSLRPEDSYNAEARESAERYLAIASRLAEKAEQPKEKPPETGIRFYWNGIKVDCGKLIPCYYWAGDGKVTISARDYGHLPTQYFTVRNDSDPMSDYFDSDGTTLTSEHPLYKFAYYAAWRQKVKDLPKYIEKRREQLAQPERYSGVHAGIRREIEQFEQDLATFAGMKDPGQPGPDDLAAVAEMKTAAESARIAAEHAEKLAQQEEYLRRRSAGRVYIEGIMDQHPLQDGEPEVEITYSEHPAFHGWTEVSGRRLFLSVAAMDEILHNLDAEQADAENSRHYEIHFVIRCTDPETEKLRTHDGEYTIGVGEGGIIAHIRQYAERLKSIHPEDAEQADSISRLADFLEQYTAAGRVVDVRPAPWLLDFAKERKRLEQRKEAARQEKAEQTEQAMDYLLERTSMLTDEQVESIIFQMDKNNGNELYAARFFAQELVRRRGEAYALSVFRRWLRDT